LARPASPTVRRKELAGRLKALRTRAELTLEDAAAELESSPATISRIENAIRLPRARDVRDLCRLYGVDADETARLTDLVDAAKEPGWWESYTEVDDDYATFIGLESAATSIRQFESAVIPGMLQIPDYARSYLRDATSPGRIKPFSEHHVEKRTEVRMKRQEILHSTSPLMYSATIDEGTLWRTVGGTKIMKAQLLHAAQLADAPNITVRVIPFSRGAHPGQPGGFSVIELPQEALSNVVYVDSLAGQLFLESEEHLVRYARVLKKLDEMALDPPESQEALRNIAHQL
jgi:transcriptional regulator with XRE-family HTH domain